MRQLGVLARADDGGLGAQTRELCEHLHADVALVVLMGEGARGCEALERVPAGRVVANPGPRLFDDILAGVLADIDVLYTIEGPYHPDLAGACRSHGVELVLHANPELYRSWEYHRLLVPTTWRLAQMPSDAELVPFPINCERLLPEPRAEEPKLCHLMGPAMLDRQGTRLVFDALAGVTTPCELVVRHDGPPAEDRYGHVRVRWLPRAADYWHAIPADSWALLQPRRYGGLSLPIQEAAALGMPTIGLARSPEQDFYGPVTHCASITVEDAYAMAGGEVAVADTDPRYLAELIDWYLEHPTPPEHCRMWASELSWDRQLATYERILR